MSKIHFQSILHSTIWNKNSLRVGDKYILNDSYIVIFAKFKFKVSIAALSSSWESNIKHKSDFSALYNAAFSLDALLKAAGERSTCFANGLWGHLGPFRLH